MPRFAILIHDHPSRHWDFLLETGELCRTFRLLADPDALTSSIPAEELESHRLLYLDYEGPVSGQRGVVTRWDWGTFEWINNTPTVCEVALNGARWKGIVRLRQHPASGWTCFRQ